MLILESMVNKPIENLQSFLRRISYDNAIPKVVPDGIFGQQTYDAVIKFQKEFGLPQTGIVNYDTWKKVQEVHKNTLKKYTVPKPVNVFPSPHFVITDNDENEIVYVIQAFLKALGENFENLDDVEINGRYDNQTKNAVITIQNASGIKENGVVDKETWEAIAILFETFVSNNYIEPLQKNGKYIIRNP